MAEHEFPDETPCAGCGWPKYCCLCPQDDEDEEEVIQQSTAA